MTYIPDPIERLESQIENNIERYCKGDLILCSGKCGRWLSMNHNWVSASDHPAAPVVCEDCAYDIPGWAAFVESATPDELPF